MSSNIAIKEAGKETTKKIVEENVPYFENFIKGNEKPEISNKEQNKEQGKTEKLEDRQALIQQSTNIPESYSGLIEEELEEEQYKTRLKRINEYLDQCGRNTEEDRKNIEEQDKKIKEHDEFLELQKKYMKERDKKREQDREDIKKHDEKIERYEKEFKVQSKRIEEKLKRLSEISEGFFATLKDVGKPKYTVFNSLKVSNSSNDFPGSGRSVDIKPDIDLNQKCPFDKL